ncbi:MAG: hypothetical protein M1822_008144 [Bathelium mastoideum]|nr:MAG: hypothetical protein M1822_008144 [Bathelium mastoideum]
MSSIFGLDDLRGLIRQFPLGQSYGTTSGEDSLVSTVRETHLLTSTSMKEDLRKLHESARERISLETLPSRFDINASQCMAALEFELDHYLLSSDKQSIIPLVEQVAILDELRAISDRIGVSMKRFAHGNDMNYHQTRGLVEKLNNTQPSAPSSVHFEILEDGDSLISKRAHRAYLTSIADIMYEAQHQSIRRELDVRSTFQNLSLPKSFTLTLGEQILTENHASISGWIQDRGQEFVLFTPNSFIVQALGTGKLQHMDLLEPVSRPYGGQRLLEKSTTFLREQIVHSRNAYTINNRTVLSSQWVQEVARQTDNDLSIVGVTRVSLPDCPDRVRSAVTNLLKHSSSNGSEASSTNFLLQIPCTRFGDIIVSEKWRHDLDSALEQAARDSAIHQVESVTRVPTFDVAKALEDLLKSMKGLTSTDRSDLRHRLLDRHLSNHVKSAFDGELTRTYAVTRERFQFQYFDRILCKAELAHEFIKGIKGQEDLARVLKETLETWVQETLIPLNLKPQSPLSRLANQCNDKALSRKLDDLKTQWRGLEDLRSLPPSYHIVELADDIAARQKAKESLIQKQQEHLSKETKPLDGLLELIVILLARRAPGFAHARGKHIPKLISLLESLRRNDTSGTEMADLLGTLDELKNKVKLGDAGEPEIEQMRDIERRDVTRVFH